MDESALLSRLESLEKKVDAAYQAAERTRKYTLTITVISVVAFVLPAIGLIFAIPSFIATFSQIGNI